MNVKRIHAAVERLEGVAIQTPFTFNHNLSDNFKSNIYLKREDMQVVRSFKLRGAYNKMAQLNDSEKEQGIICASAGNHAQGVAFACNKLKIKGKIFMPIPTPAQKVQKVKHFGKSWIEIVLAGDTYDDAYELALVSCKQEQRCFIHPFEDLEVIAGQGTVAHEILEQSPVSLDYLLVAVGGGGLLSGVGSYFKQQSPDTRIISVESEGAAGFYNSYAKNKLIALDQIDTFADGIAVRKMGEQTFDICKDVVDETLIVPEGKICSTILKLYNEEAIVVEPAGAISIAALDQLANKIENKNVGIIICGGNNDIERTQEIKERALIYEGLKHYFIIRFPQRAGALKDFLNVLGPHDDISHFQYIKKNSRQSGPALVGIELTNQSDFEPLIQRMEKQKINFQHINNNPTLFEILV